MNSFLQSPPWARFQRRLGRQVFEADEPGFSYLAVLESNAVGRYLYCPYGPVADDAEGFAAALASLTELARAHHGRFIRVEPVDASLPSGPDAQAALAGAGLVKAPRDIQPSLSWLIDLRAEEKALLAAMKSTNRNLHRNIGKKDVTFTASSDPADIEILLTFLHQTAEQSKFTPQDDTYLRTAAQSLMPSGDATLYVARLHGEPIGAALVYDSADTRTYAHAAVDREHRRLSAGIPLVVRLILDARHKGLSTFDMWGIAPDSEPDHPWAGFTYFKKSFGGAPVRHPGTWDMPVNGPAYRAYRLARAGGQRLRSATRGAVRRAKAARR